jgi:hypothetical protein
MGIGEPDKVQEKASVRQSPRVVREGKGKVSASGRAVKEGG